VRGESRRRLTEKTAELDGMIDREAPFPGHRDHGGFDGGPEDAPDGSAMPKSDS
jgi:hypothetical protein